MRRGRRTRPATRYRTSPPPTARAATSCRMPPSRRAARAPLPAGAPGARRAARRGNVPRPPCTTGSLREVLRQLVLPEPGVRGRFLVGLDGAEHLRVGAIAAHVVARLRQLVVAAVGRLAADVHAAAPVQIGLTVVALPAA